MHYQYHLHVIHFEITQLLTRLLKMADVLFESEKKKQEKENIKEEDFNKEMLPYAEIGLQKL